MAEAFDFFAQDVEDAHFRDVVVIFDNKVVIGRVGENFEVSSLRSKLCTYGFISNYSRIRIGFCYHGFETFITEQLHGQFGIAYYTVGIKVNGKGRGSVGWDGIRLVQAEGKFEPLATFHQTVAGEVPELETVRV